MDFSDVGDNRRAAKKVARCGVERESMEFDVVVVGAGPAGLSAAIRLMQLAARIRRDVRRRFAWSKRALRWARTSSPGLCWSPACLNELLPDWQDRGAPLNTPVTGDTFYFYTGQDSAIKLPGFAIPDPPIMTATTSSPWAMCAAG
jgi:electron-transferring-flavoprotein dehydrogenase